MSTTTSRIEHEPYCLPRPGEDEPRIEKYVLPTYDQSGVRIVGMTSVERCTECGSALYDGQRRR